jgi:EpsI family protein
LKGSFALRLIVATAIIAATYGAMYALKAAIKPPEVVFPAWCHRDNDEKKELCVNLPLKLGAWSGKKEKLDPAIFNATQATIAEDRSYNDGNGHNVSLHFAMFADVDASVVHCPTNCYRANGWQCFEESKEPLKVEQTSAPKVYYSRWDKEGQHQCLVVHWYQWDDSILYDRLGLGMTRSALLGRPTWPPVFKILLQNQINATSDEDKDRLLDFAKQIYAWLNSQSHKAGDDSAASEESKPLKAEESKISAKEKKAD